MLLLFRKIRQTLLERKKISKYILYALGEITLVVIGILIAVNLDNANQIRKDNIRSDIYLKRLLEDLEIMRLDAERAVEHNQVMIDASITTKNLLETGQLDPDEKAALDNYLYRFHQFTINVQDAKSYLEMMSSGELSLIKNRWIRDTFQELADYRDFLLFVGRSFDDQALDDFEHLEKYVRFDIVQHRTDSSKVIPQYDFQAMSKDPVLINVISKQSIYWHDAIFQHRRYLSLVKVLEDSVAKQVAMIR